MQLLFFIFIISLTSLSLSSSQPHHLVPPHHNHHYHPHPPPLTESVELNPPSPTSKLPHPSPQCTLSLLRHSFANTMSKPPLTVPYFPPSHCPPPWSSAVLHLSGAVSGHQYDRIAAVWLGGVEILRTSTPQPFDNGTFWNVHKDITRYSSLLQQSNVSLSMMLENEVNRVFTGVYRINLEVLFYKDNDTVKGEGDSECRCQKLGLGLGLGLEDEGLRGNRYYEEPADLIIPMVDDGPNGFWFRIEDETHLVSKSLVIPMNARRMVLELYVSFHGDDEFWYSNPPNRYIQANNLTTSRGNGAFREVFLNIDGKFVASEIPFPVVYPGGINPAFWEPVVGISAFNLPSYDFDLTPFLGSLSDGEPHVFELGVAHAIPYWLVNANIHLWVENGSSIVQSQMSYYQPPNFLESRVYNFKQLDGIFQVITKRKSLSSGWVNFACGNLTTIVSKSVNFKNMVTLEKNGTYKVIKQKVKVKSQVRVISSTNGIVFRGKVKRKFPLQLITSIMPGTENDTDLLITNISYALQEKSVYGKEKTSYSNSQESGGWVAVRADSVISGVAETQQAIVYQDSAGCFIRSVGARGGELMRDNSTFICPSIVRKVLNVFLRSW